MVHTNHLLPRQHQQQVFGCQVYGSPSANQVIEAYSTVTIEWNPHCIDAEQNIDIYLQSLDTNQPIHAWKNVVVSSNRLSTQFIPDWWNRTESASLQLVITPSELPIWAGLGPGPTFAAHFNGTVPSGAPTSSNFKNGKSTGGLSIEYITDLYHRSHHALSGGKLGAAIFFPLFAVALAISGYIILSRRRTGQASKRWSQYVDQRMSVIGSQTWESAAAADDVLPTARGIPGSRVASMYRQSIAVPDSRAMSMYRHSASLPPNRNYMSNARLSTFSFNPQDSPVKPFTHTRGGSLTNSAPRVSFADAPRPNSEVIYKSGSHSRTTSSNSNSPSFGPKNHLNSSFNRSTSNLRFQVDQIPDRPRTQVDCDLPPPESRFSNFSKPASLKLDTSVSSILQSNQSNLSSSDHANGMKRMDLDTSALSPDEALRQYTLFRNRGDENPNGGGSKGEMKILYNQGPKSDKSSSNDHK